MEVLTGELRSAVRNTRSAEEYFKIVDKIWEQGTKSIIKWNGVLLTGVDDQNEKERKREYYKIALDQYLTYGLEELHGFEDIIGGVVDSFTGEGGVKAKLGKIAPAGKVIEDMRKESGNQGIATRNLYYIKNLLTLTNEEYKALEEKVYDIKRRCYYCRVEILKRLQNR